MIIFRSLDLSIFDHCMFWAACNLAYFGFLRSAEFTVPNLASFTPALRLSVGDISVNSDANPSCLRVRIKAFSERLLCPHLQGTLPSVRPSSCFGLFGSERKLGWPSFSFPGWSAPNSRCPHCSSQRNLSWSRCVGQFLQSQFLHWCGHGGSSQRRP